MSEQKLSPELIDKITATEFPELIIECNRGNFYNEFNKNSENSSSEPNLATALARKNLKEISGESSTILKGKIFIKKTLEIEDEDIPQDMRNIGINLFRRNKNIDIDDELKCEDDLDYWQKYLKTSEKISYFDELEQITGIKIVTKEDLKEALKYTQWENNRVTYGCMFTYYPHCISLSEFSFSVKQGDSKAIEVANKMLSYLKLRVMFALFHELKHVKNALLCQHRPYASDYKEPTMKEKYKLSVEDERTAKFNSVNETIKKYLKVGNWQDFSIFPREMDWVVEKLKGKSDKQIKKICYPPIKLMNECLKNWNKWNSETYFAQMQSVCDDSCCNSLLIPTDTTEGEFKKQRSLMYTYEVYNPYTGKNEIMDLSPAIEVDIPISDKVQKEIIEPCEKKRKQAKDELYALIPDRKTEILAANFAETLKREKVAQWFSKSKNSDAEAIMDRVRFAQPVKTTKRNFVAKKIKMVMKQLPSPERALKYAAVISAFLSITGTVSFAQNDKEEPTYNYWEATYGKLPRLKPGILEVVEGKEGFSEIVAEKINRGERDTKWTVKLVTKTKDVSGHPESLGLFIKGDKEH